MPVSARTTARLGACLAAVALAGAARAGDLGGGRWAVENPTGEVVRVEAWDPVERVWRPITLKPSQRQDLPYAGERGTGRMRVATRGRGHVEHVARAGVAYRVLWDASLNLWTFRLAE